MAGVAQARQHFFTKFANFMQPTGLCSEFDYNLFVCDTRLGEISIVTGLRGTCQFLSVIGKLYRCFGVHKKHQVVPPLEADKVNNAKKLLLTK